MPSTGPVKMESVSTPTNGTQPTNTNKETQSPTSPQTAKVKSQVDVCRNARVKKVQSY